MNEWNDLELFEHVKLRSKTPLITFKFCKQYKTITLNAAFARHAKEHMQNKKYVQLKYSKAKNAIVLNFVDIASKTSFKLSKSRTSVGFRICATSFFNYYNITEQGVFETKLENIPNIGDAWVVYLNREIKI